MSFLSHSLSQLSILATILIVLLIILSVRRQRDEPITRQSPVSDSGDDNRNHWFLGVFYADPDDPAVFVKKRFGYGRTLNFGHWISWLILATPILIALAARIASARHH